MASPPKPWERAGGVSSTASSAPLPPAPSSSLAQISDAGPPALPTRSSAMAGGATSAYNRPGKPWLYD